MAFVKLESKTSDTEIIIFPSIYEANKDKLVVDNVVKIAGRVNAKDKDGNPTPDVKVLADAVEVISDATLRDYEHTGSHLGAPVKTERPKFRMKGAAAAMPDVAHIYNAPKDHKKERLYLLIKNPTDAELLTKVKSLCDSYPGQTDVILVLADSGEKRPLKLPFQVDAIKSLITPLKELLGEDSVKVK